MCPTASQFFNVMKNITRASGYMSNIPLPLSGPVLQHIASRHGSPWSHQPQAAPSAQPHGTQGQTRS